ncbi:MAG: NAD-dependent epimerase/dehydratase family protein, partial [bacterium]
MAERVLITGGAGFIGSHLADALLARGHMVAVLDNFSTGRRRYVPEAATLYDADLLDSARLREALADFAPTVVSHHAAQINVRIALDDPIRDAATNILGALVLLEACLAAGVQQFVFASSGGAMYGDDAPRPTSEAIPPGPESPYGLSKLTFEEYLRVLGRLHPELIITILRYANVYGPRQIVEGEAG